MAHILIMILLMLEPFRPMCTKNLGDIPITYLLDKNVAFYLTKNEMTETS